MNKVKGDSAKMRKLQETQAEALREGTLHGEDPDNAVNAVKEEPDMSKEQRERWEVRHVQASVQGPQGRTP